MIVNGLNIDDSRPTGTPAESLCSTPDSSTPLEQHRAIPGWSEDGFNDVSQAERAAIFFHRRADASTSSALSKSLLDTCQPQSPKSSTVDEGNVTSPPRQRKRPLTSIETEDKASSVGSDSKKRKTLPQDDRAPDDIPSASASRSSAGNISVDDLIKASLKAAKKLRKDNGTISSAVDETQISKLVILITDALGSEGAIYVRELVIKPADWSSIAVRKFQQGLREAKNQLAQMVNAYRTYLTVDATEPLGNWLKLISLALLGRKHARAVDEMGNPDSSTSKAIAASEAGAEGIERLGNSTLVSRYLLEEINKLNLEGIKVTSNQVQDSVIAGKVVNLYEARFGRGLFALLGVKVSYWRRFPRDIHEAVSTTLAQNQDFVAICDAVYDHIVKPLLDKRNTGVAEMQRTMKSWDGKLESLGSLFTEA